MISIWIRGQSDTAAGSALLSLLGVDLQGVTAQLGLGCSPISAIGVGSGNGCASNAVCCQNNNVVSVVSGVLVRLGLVLTGNYIFS